MEKRVLIVAPPDDFHTAAVAWALQEYGVTVDLMDMSADVRGASYSVRTDSDYFTLLDRQVPIQNYLSVWRRRVYRRRAADTGRTSDSQFIRLESETFDRNYLDAICARTNTCVNDRLNNQRAENKQLQLLIAREAGLKIPDTLISQNPTLIREFVLKNEKCIVKPQVGQLWSNEATKQLHTTGTSELPKSWVEHPKFEDSSSLCPAIYQKEIQKESDLRAVVFGNHIECIEIKSTKADPELDCRATIIQGNAVAKRTSLDVNTTRAIRHMMNRFGICYASMDFARDEDGSLYFLDLNPAGQFLFVEELAPDTRLLEQFARYLAGGTAFNDERTPRICLAEFEQSHACDTWCQDWGSGRRRNRADEVLVSVE